MPNKLERFTQRARRVLSLGQEEAEQMNHSEIGTEHILLGLIRDDGGIAGRVLSNLGVTIETARKIVMSIRPIQPYAITSRLDLTGEAKVLLEHSVDQARQMGHHYIGTEHFLLGMLANPGTTGAKILTQMNLELTAVREKTLQVLAESPIQRSSPPSRFLSVQPGMENLTSRVQQVIDFAREEAEELHYHYIGTEHLLLALIRQQEGIAGHLLRSLGLTLGKTRELVYLVGEERDPGGSQSEKTLDFTPKFNKILTLAREEAQKVGHEDISTVDLLFGILEIPECKALEILQKLGITAEQIREKLPAVYSEDASQPTAKPPEEPTLLPKLELSEKRSVQRHPNQMERFTQRVRRVFSLAQEEAERLQHSYIGTEHLLLGLMREDGGVAGRVLRDLGLDQRHIEELVERITRAGRRTSNAKLDLSPGTKRVLELSVDEARRMGHHYIGTEHLLLGLVRQYDGVAIEILKRLNVSPEEVRRQTRRVLQEAPVQRSQRPEIVESRSEKAASRHSEPVRYNHRAQQALAFAQEEAERLNREYVGTEHLLLGLMHDVDSIAWRVLSNLGLDQRQIQDLTEQIAPAGEGEANKPIEFSARLKNLLDLAADEMRSMSQATLSTGHLLLGMVRQTDGVAIEIFKHLNISPVDVRRNLQLALQGMSAVDRQEPIKEQTERLATDRRRWKFVPGESRMIFDAAIENATLQHRNVGSEDFLLAMLADDHYHAAFLLTEMAITFQKVAELIAAQPDGTQETPPEFSPEAIQLIGLAMVESHRWGGIYLRSEHLLLGLLRQKESAAIDILKKLGADPETMEKSIREALK